MKAHLRRLLILCGSAFLLVGDARAQSFNFNTIAGNSHYYGSADGTGTNATFFAPAGIALDTNGNLLVTDSINDTIRKITPAGVVTTYAGSPRFSGDENNLRIGNGAGPNAVLHNSLRLCVDNSGNVFITEANNTVRKATADVTGTNWMVTTIAGNPAPFPIGSTDGTGTAALFRSLDGITVDGGGDIYVADEGNELVRRLTFTGSNWLVKTLSVIITDTSALTFGPADMAADNAGNLWAADASYVRKLTGSGTNWTAKIVAGKSTQGSADGIGTNASFWVATAVATDVHGNVYVGDFANNNVRMISPSGTNYAVKTIAGRATVSGSADGAGTNSMFFQPEGICVDSHSNVFVADTLNHTIRRVSPDATGTNWVTTTIAGQAGNFGTTDGPGASALFFRPSGIAVDANTNVYVCDNGDSLLRKLTPTTSNWMVTTVAGALQRATGPAEGAGFLTPMGVAVDLNGNAYVADKGSSSIRKISPAQVVTTLAGQPGNSGSALGTGNLAQFSQPNGITVDTNGSAYVAETRFSQIRKVTSAGQTTIFAGSTAGWQDATGGSAKFNAPQGVAADRPGNIYVADTKNDVIRQISPSAAVTTLAGQPGIPGSADGTGMGAQFALPEGIAVDTHGNLFVADTANCTVRKLTLSGTNWIVSTIAGQQGNPGSTDGTGTNALFNCPHSLVVDTNGNIYVADKFNSLIRKITPSGSNWVVTTFAGSVGASDNGLRAGTNERLAAPTALVLDASNNLFLADSGSSLIRELTLSGTNWLVTNVAGLPTSSGSPGSVDGTGSQAQFAVPQGIGIDSARNLYVADSGNHTIRMLVASGNNWTVTTIAGTAGIKGSTDGTNGNAEFNTPRGVAPDKNGNLYVSDSLNDTIRKMTLVSGNWVVSTIAGQAGTNGFADGVGTNALFYLPSAIATDTNGNLYVADSGNSCIRQFTPSNTTWVVTTIAGQPGVFGSADGNGGSALFNWPVGVTVDHLGNLWVGDFLNNTIRRLTHGAGTNWTVTTVGGLPGVAGNSEGPGTNTLFFFPTSAVADPSGIIYVADGENETMHIGMAPLALQIMSAGNKVVLTWSLWATNYVLETTNALPNAVHPWIPITNGVTTSRYNYVLTNSIVPPSAYFRLHGQ